MQRHFCGERVQSFRQILKEPQDPRERHVLRFSGEQAKHGPGPRGTCIALYVRGEEEGDAKCEVVFTNSGQHGLR